VMVVVVTAVRGCCLWQTALAVPSGQPTKDQSHGETRPGNTAYRCRGTIAHWPHALLSASPHAVAINPHSFLSVFLSVLSFSLCFFSYFLGLLLSPNPCTHRTFRRGRSHACVPSCRATPPQIGAHEAPAAGDGAVVTVDVAADTAAASETEPPPPPPHPGRRPPIDPFPDGRRPAVAGRALPVPSSASKHAKLLV